MTTTANQATINPTLEQRAMRTIARVKRLRMAIAEAQAAGNDQRRASLQEELDRRVGEAGRLKAQLESI